MNVNQDHYLRLLRLGYPIDRSNLNVSCLLYVPYLIDITKRKLLRRESSFLNYLKEKNFILEFDGYKISRINAKAPFMPRDGAGAVVHDGSLFLIGGWNPYCTYNSGKVIDCFFPKITTNEVWRSDDNGRKWYQIKKNTYDDSFNHFFDSDWRGRHNFGCVSFNGYIYIIGGDAAQGHYINDVWRSKNGIEWELVNPVPPWAPRVLFMTLVFRDYIYIIGGQTMSRTVAQYKSQYKNNMIKETYYNDIWRSKDGFNWEPVLSDLDHALPLLAGIGGSGFVLNDRIILPGGFNFNSMNKEYEFISSQVWSSSGGLEKWNCVSRDMYSGSRFKPMVYQDVGCFDKKIWTIGGMVMSKDETNGKMIGVDQSAIRYSSDGISWKECELSPIIPTHSTSVWSTVDGLVLACGHGWSKEVWMISTN